MYKKVTTLVAFGFICANAANTINYDLLGRRGSQMNSPMVYKNIDYSKMKKEGLGSSIENHGLMKLASGLSGNVSALVGAYCNKGLDYVTNYPVPYYLKRFYTNGNVQENWYDVLTGNWGYMGPANDVFIPVPLWQNYTPNYELGNETNVNPFVYDFSAAYNSFSNPVLPSPYYNNENITYKSFFEVEYPKSKRASIALWYDAGYGLCTACDEVGVYMVVDALPVKLDADPDDSRDVKFIKHTPWEQFYATPETEMLSARTYSIIKRSARNSVIYVGKNAPSNPAHPNWMGISGPQMYIGIHNRKDNNINTPEAMFYSGAARALDNYIYEKRTVEIVPAGNYWIRNVSGHLASEAHAANAITVGAIDADNGTITKYTSNKTRYCTAGIENCHDTFSGDEGSSKPEIFNYSHFYMTADETNPDRNEKKRTYRRKSDNKLYTYLPYYDGTEFSAAYTAGMVANLMAANPFYRWHPEVVKALLISSGDVNINQPYPHSEIPATTKIPSYYSLIFDKDYSTYYHYSRYWIGEMDKLKTHVYSNKKEIRFSVKRPTDRTNFSAAIAWLSSGNDIANLGKIPQNFDFYVYENSSENVNNINVGSPLNFSKSTKDAFEKISFTSNANYLTFRIRLSSEDSRSENNGQVVLGFDLASGVY